MNNSHLRFKLKTECFAVPVGQVLKILEYKEVTSVPKAPPFLKGVINWQGSLLPVIDLNLKLGYKETELKKETCILVLDLNLDSDHSILGCIVDEVKAVITINPEEIIASPSIGDKYRSDLVLGMYPDQDLFVILLDFVKIFENDETLILSNNELNDNISDHSEK
jgi:purine-binding chemotaxis protein CheW